MQQKPGRVGSTQPDQTQFWKPLILQPHFKVQAKNAHATHEIELRLLHHVQEEFVV
jgi:hypothetical protein